MKIAIVSSWCWQGLYIDGKLVHEDERISLSKFLEYVKHNLDVSYISVEDLDDYFPNSLDDFVVERGGRA